MTDARYHRGRTVAIAAMVAALVSLILATPAGASHFDTQATAANVRVPLGINATFADVQCPPSPQSESVADLSVPGIVEANTLNAACDEEDASASIQEATILNTIELGLIQSECTRGPGGATGSSSVVVLNGGGVLPDNTTITAPTAVNLGLVQIRLNQQFTDNDGNLTVVAVGLSGPGGLRVSLAQVKCANVYPLSGGAPPAASVDLPAPGPISDASTSGFLLTVAVAAVAALCVQLGLARVVRRTRGGRRESTA